MNQEPCTAGRTLAGAARCAALSALLTPLLLAGAPQPVAEPKWRELVPGLHVAEFDSPRKSVVGDSKITVVRIDPDQHELKLLCASEDGGRKRTAKDWCRKFDLLCAINASMYGKDGLTPVAYMKRGDRLVNSRMTADKAVIAFDRTSTNVPLVQIIDLQYQDFEGLRNSYGTLVQNIRVVSTKGENVWQKQQRIWSMSVLGMDRKGNVLFIFTRSPYPVHDFADILRALPLDLLNAAYLDGGPPASLYVGTRGFEADLFGSYETGVREDDDAVIPWRIPNVIGVAKKSPAGGK